MGESEVDLRERAETWVKSFEMHSFLRDEHAETAAASDIRALIAHLDKKCERAFFAAADLYVNVDEVREELLAYYTDWNKGQG